MPKDEISIANMSGGELITYLHTLSKKQAEYSKLKIQKTEELIPIDQKRAQLKADIQTITEKQRQVKTEIAACKYAIKAEGENVR